MSELKHQLMLNKDMSWAPCYLKSEADKMIADLEESHKKEVEQLIMTILELKEKLAAPQLVQRLNEPEALYSDLETMARLSHEKDVVARRERHHKYKRCLAMAGRCFTKSNYHFVLARHGEDVKENNRKSILYSKWRKRWLYIAKKFKPNSTAQ